jgi:AAA family ATP:ADP antiporter
MLRGRVVDERRQVVALVAKLCLFAYLVLASYAIARPPIESMFLAAHQSRGLPAVWLAVAATVLVAVGAMRRAVARWSLTRVFIGAAVASSIILAALLSARAAGVPGASFALYVWKDVYVVVLIELFWSIANVISPAARARWTYGLYCLAGSLGGASGNLLVGALSQRIGSAAATWLVIPLLAAGCLACLAVGSGARAAIAAPVVAALPPGGAAQPGVVVRRSKTLLIMLAVVVVAQLTITLIDFQFNAVVEREITDVDTRTAAIGRVYAVVDLASMLLQVASGPLLTAIGVPATLVAVPLVLGLALVGVAAVPRFSSVAASKIASKSLDYSIFRVAKELCYVPLGYAEKTQGKAIVDVLVYRLAKAGASLLLLGLAAAHVTGLVVPIALGAVGLWALLAVLLGRSHARLLTRS